MDVSNFLIFLACMIFAWSSFSINILTRNPGWVKFVSGICGYLGVIGAWVVVIVNILRWTGVT